MGVQALLQPTRIQNIAIYEGAGLNYIFRPDQEIPEGALVFMRAYSGRDFKGQSYVSVWTGERTVDGHYRFEQEDDVIYDSRIEHGSAYKIYVQPDIHDRSTRKPEQTGRFLIL
ncbi:hypothetical protein SEA_JUMBO_40 [Gordonia phage Jumbo]|uniref:Uncharacterized protein n=1 Tax=Gordonia phage Jumbo TaxID=1887650 RepID=A0A1B3B0J3_9CAUD|nr:hypothetical protein BIZ69_gp040 [Gordonia phage Jumbo]AOE44550.1 hypothetical protein SEA_JUMBO_40 [Gordonia phage Jumbo]